MAQPPFPMHPRSARDHGAMDVAPVFGAGPGDDPGYLRSLRTGTVLGRMRATMLVLLAAPVAILAISPFIVRDGDGRFGGAPPWIYAPLAVVALAAVLVGPRAPRALPHPAGPPAPPRVLVARASLLQFRSAVLLRFALTEAVILVGLPLAMVGHSELVFAAGFAVGYPLLVRLALPTRGGVERIRRRLEAGGAESLLWPALLAPAPPRRSAGDA